MVLVIGAKCKIFGSDEVLVEDGYLSSNPSGIAERLAAGAQEDVDGLTRAGRALEKHGSRPGSVFPRATGNIAAKNAQGQQILEEILRSNNQRTVPNRFGGHDIFNLGSGRGVRFAGNGEMIGFLEP
jgi:hypothetical protein